MTNLHMSITISLDDIEKRYRRAGDSVPKKSMEILTESMFYVLMALGSGPMCGIDIAEWVKARSRERVALGPATLYTILGKFEKEGFIRETEVEGRKRTYSITDKGLEAYDTERNRLRRCIADADEAGKENPHG